MHLQLEEIAGEFRSASERVQRLITQVSEAMWTQRPADGGWSCAECVAHLNITSATFVPVIRAALDEAQQRREPAPARYRRDPIGWLLWRTMGPPARFRLKTAAAFVPGAVLPAAELASEFERLQAEQMACVQAGDGKPLHKVSIRSPFDPRVKYSLFSAFSILPRHQHRHLWQAEQVQRALTSATR